MVSDHVLEIDTHVQNRIRGLPTCFGRRCSRTPVPVYFPQLPWVGLLCCSQSPARPLKPCMDFPFLFFLVLKTERFHRQGEQKLFAESLTCKAWFSLPNSEANRGWEQGRGMGGFAPLYKILLLPCGGLAHGGPGAAADHIWPQLQSGLGSQIWALEADLASSIPGGEERVKVFFQPRSAEIGKALGCGRGASGNLEQPGTSPGLAPVKLLGSLDAQVTLLERLWQSLPAQKLTPSVSSDGNAFCPDSQNYRL